MMRLVTEEDLPLQCIYRWEHTRPQQIFLTQPFDRGKVRDWTWSQAMDEVRRMAAYLKAQNWEPGSRVAILSRNCAWWILADLAIWMAGYVSVPIYPSLRAQTVRQILDHSDAKACFLGATDENGNMLRDIPSTVTCIGFPTAPDGDYNDWGSLVSAHTPMEGNPTRGMRDLATIIYTSGTTGTPKGVMHCFEALAFDAKTCTIMLGFDQNERILSYLPLAHVVERMGVEILSVLLGSHVFFTEGLETFVQDLQRARPSIFLSVPRLLLKFQQGVFTKIPRTKLQKLLRIPVVNRVIKRRILHQLGLSTVRVAACGAAPLPVEILMWFRSLGLNLVEGYGMTETWVTHLPAPGDFRPHYVGKAIPGVEAKLGANGELLIRSPMNMLGYFKDPQGSHDCLTEDGYFHTGDMVEIAPDGQTRIVGRVKEQFKTSKGKYVAPAPIEGRLVTHPAIETGCLMGAGLPSPFAVILLTEEARKRCSSPQEKAALEESLLAQMEQLNEHLEPHERVKFLAIADGPWTIGNGMITPTFKIKRNALEARYQACIDEWRDRNTPVVWESDPAPPSEPYKATAAADTPLRQSD